MFGINTTAEAQDYYDVVKDKQVEPSDAYEWAIDLAEAEGCLEMFLLVDDMRERLVGKGWNQDRVLFGLLNTIARELEKGANDTWSGRGNEKNRAKFDGKREAARNIRYALEAEMNKAIRAEQDA